MFITNDLVITVRSALDFFPLEQALTLGLFFFALSWIFPRRIVNFPPAGERVTALVRLGVWGSIFILATAAITSHLSYLYAFPDDSGFGGWWRRAAPLGVTALVIAMSVISLGKGPRPAPGERVIAPRRSWSTFTPSKQLWLTIGVAVLLLATSLWQTFSGVSAPAGSNRYGNVPAETDLPIYLVMQGGMGYIAGAGWPNYLATLICLAAACIALRFVLNADANRSISMHDSASTFRMERSSTAQMLLWLLLGGLLLTLGAVWAHTGFIGSIIVSVDENVPSEQLGTAERYYIGTGYRDFAELIHLGGYIVQGLGAALLLRVIVDTLRAKRTSSSEISTTQDGSDTSVKAAR